MIRFRCTKCQTVLQATDAHAGRTVECTGCGQRLRVPSAPAAVADDPHEPEPGAGFATGEGAEEEVVVRAAPRRRASNAWLRFTSPSVLFLALILFPLPWLEVQGSGPQGKTVLLTQSGLQTATGDYSKGSELEQLEQMGKQAGGGMAGGGMKVGPGNEDDKIDKAPLMWAFPALLVVGIVVGLAVRPAAPRLPIVGLCGALAAGVLLVHMIIGFPIDRKVDDENKKQASKPAVPASPFPGKVDPFDPFGGGGGDPFKMMGGDALKPTIAVKRTAWFWLALVVSAIGMAPILFGSIIAQ